MSVVLLLAPVGAIALLFLFCAGVIVSAPGRVFVTSTLESSSGMTLPLEFSAVVDAEVVWRRNLFLWASAGALASGLLLLAVDTDSLIVSDLHLTLVLAVTFGALSGLVGIARGERRPTAAAGFGVESPGSPLGSVIGSLAITMGWIISLLALTFAGITIWLAVTEGYGDRSMSDVVARVSVTVGFALVCPIVLTIASILSNRRRTEPTHQHLAWREALLAQRTWALVLATSVLIAAVINGMGRVASDLLPPTPDHVADRVVMSVATMICSVLIVVYAAVVTRTKPQRRYLHENWPDLAADRSVGG